MRSLKPVIIISLIFFFSCERRIFLDKLPQIVYDNERYIFESYGYEYDHIILSSETSVIELSSTKESQSSPEVIYNTEPGYYDLYLITGIDTVLVNTCYVGNCVQETLKITILDVCQGDCFIISPPDGPSSVIDGGYGSTGYEEWQGGGEKILTGHLESQDIFSMKYVIETHHDQDHYGGLYDLTNDQSFTYSDYLTCDSELLDIGDTLYFSPSVKGIVIHSGMITGSEDAGENDRSVVLKLIYGDFEMMFTGDITNIAEDFILSGTLLNVSEDYEILKAAHHGSKYASGEAFLNAVLPVFSVISSGEGNPYGHPSEEVLGRLENAGSSVLRTDIKGTLEIYSDGSSFQISYSR